MCIRDRLTGARSKCSSRKQDITGVTKRHGSDVYKRQEPEDEMAIERYLGSGAIHGIGLALAARIVRRFKTVSYTHLDVYKRQNAGSVVRAIKRLKCKERGDSVVELDNFKSTLQGYKAVSYTHLDVYKRQGKDIHMGIWYEGVLRLQKFHT